MPVFVTKCKHERCLGSAFGDDKKRGLMASSFARYEPANRILRVGNVKG